MAVWRRQLATVGFGFLFMLAFAIVGTSCGGGGEASPTPTPTPTPAPPASPDSGAPAVDAGARPNATPSSASADAGAAADGATAANDPNSWSRIYADLFMSPSNPSNCAGALCHAPGKEHGIDLSTVAVGHATILPHLVPGSPDQSQLIFVLQSGSMPQGRPRLSAADIARVRAWIQAGAPNN